MILVHWLCEFILSSPSFGASTQLPFVKTRISNSHVLTSHSLDIGKPRGAKETWTRTKCSSTSVNAVSLAPTWPHSIPDIQTPPQPQHQTVIPGVLQTVTLSQLIPAGPNPLTKQSSGRSSEVNTLLTIIRKYYPQLSLGERAIGSRATDSAHPRPTVTRIVQTTRR